MHCVIRDLLNILPESAERFPYDFGFYDEGLCVVTSSEVLATDSAITMPDIVYNVLSAPCDLIPFPSLGDTLEQCFFMMVLSKVRLNR